MSFTQQTNLVRAVAFAVLFGGGLVASPVVAAESGPLDALLENSPFLPLAEAVSAGSPSGAGSALEFRGLLERGGEMMAGIFDRATGQSFWVPVGELPGAADDDAVVATLTASAYDAAENRLRGSYHERAFTLELARAFVGESPGGSASAEGTDVTEALATTLAAADAEPEFFGDDNGGRRFVLARFGATPKSAPHDEGNQLVAGLRSRVGQSPANRPATIIAPAPPPEWPAYAVADIAGDSAGALAASNPWAGLADDELLLPDGNDGGRRLLIRRRVGQTPALRRTD